jgi:hypothetical protein
MDDRTVMTISAGGADTRRTDLPHCTVVMCLSRWPAARLWDDMAGEVDPWGPGRLAGSDQEEAAPRNVVRRRFHPPAPQGQRGAYFLHLWTVKPNTARSFSPGIEWP